MSISPSARWKTNGSFTSLDGMARSTMSTDIPDARSCRDAREQSRKEMHFLNEKLASQIEKIRQLSEQNRRLMEEASGSRDRIRETEKIRQTYNNELRLLRQLVDDCEREKADTLAKMATLNQTIRTKQEQIQHLSQTNQRLSDQLDEAVKDNAAKEAEKSLLQRHIKAAQEENDRIRTILDQSKHNNQQLHKSLDEETASRMACQSEMQSLREETEFLRTVHEQELEELRALVSVDHEQDRAQWKDEMQRAIRDIQNEYDQRLDKIKNEMENNYVSKLTEMSRINHSQNAQIHDLLEENATLRNNMDSLRKRVEQFRTKCERLEDALNESNADCRSLHQRFENLQRESEKERQNSEEALNKALNELASLADAKLNLESEIAAYRRLLEAQEYLFASTEDGSRSQRVSSPGKVKELRVKVPVYTNTQSSVRSAKTESLSRWNDREEPSGQSTRSHVIERTVEGNQRLSCSYSDNEKVDVTRSENHHRGQLAITDCAPNGHFIELTNTGTTNAKIGGWCLIRNVDGGSRITRFTLPDSIVPPNASFRIWAAGKMDPRAGQYDFEAPYQTWGTGNLVTTNLYSPDGMERATHTQRLEISP